MNPASGFRKLVGTYDWDQLSLDAIIDKYRCRHVDDAFRGGIDVEYQ